MEYLEEDNPGRGGNRRGVGREKRLRGKWRVRREEGESECVGEGGGGKERGLAEVIKGGKRGEIRGGIEGGTMG